jgi:hypothetical protein
MVVSRNFELMQIRDAEPRGAASISLQQSATQLKGSVAGGAT